MSQPQKRGRKSNNGLTYGLLALLVLVAVGLTWRFGFPDHFSSVFAGEKKKDDHPGKIAILISPVPIPAFTAIDPATFINPQTGDFFVAYVTEKAAAEAKFIRDPAAMRGRVLKNDKGAGLGFSEADFFERGAKASLTSALLPGQRAVTLDSTEIEGLSRLKRFDRFDLYAVKARPQDGSRATGYLSPEAAKAAESGQEWSTDRLVIALNARILVPVTESKDGKGAKNSDNVEVAMTIEEATALADAKARGAKILCWASTGLPGGDTTKFETPVDPITVDTIQVITGDKSTTTSVPKTPEQKP